MIYYVSARFRWVLAEAEDEATAKQLALPKLNALDAKKEFPAIIESDIKIVREANSNEIDQQKTLDRFLAQEAEYRERRAIK